jgi:hypothetical protein
VDVVGQAVELRAGETLYAFPTTPAMLLKRFAGHQEGLPGRAKVLRSDKDTVGRTSLGAARGRCDLAQMCDLPLKFHPAAIRVSVGAHSLGIP